MRHLDDRPSEKVGKPLATLRAPAVGTLEWERAGGPPLSMGQRLRQLVAAATVILGDLGPRLRWRIVRGRPPAKVDLAEWAPPDTRIAREAEQYLREVSTAPMVNHSFRAYYFAGVVYELSEHKVELDREALYVAALMHDVALAKSRPPTEHCFTVGSAREARRIMTEAGWDPARQDKVALAIVSNLNVGVGLDEFGAEAYFITVGGLVEVIAQEWKVHPENVTEILARYPRDGFTKDALEHVRREAELDPGGRFACLDPLFPMIVRRASFTLERTRR